MPYVICTESSSANSPEIHPVGVRPTHDAAWEFIKWYLGTFSGKRAKDMLTRIIIRVYAFADDESDTTEYKYQAINAGELLRALAGGTNPVRRRGETADEGS